MQQPSLVLSAPLLCWSKVRASKQYLLLLTKTPPPLLPIVPPLLRSLENVDTSQSYCQFYFTGPKIFCWGCDKGEEGRRDWIVMLHTTEIYNRKTCSLVFSWITQPRIHQFQKSLCPSSCPEVSKTPPTYEVCMILSQVMALPKKQCFDFPSLIFNQNYLVKHVL